MGGFFRLNARSRDGNIDHASQGFYIEFANGWKISVQFGTNDYCDNRPREGVQVNVSEECANAEISILHKDKNGGVGWPEFAASGECVLGWVEPDELLKYMVWASRLPNHPDAAEGVVPVLD